MNKYGKELLDGCNIIYQILNSFYEDNYTFSKKDILFNFKDERNMSLIVKGVIVTLVGFGYIEVVSKKGYYNYLYKMNRRIDF